MGSDLHIAIFGKNELVREGLGSILRDEGFTVVATSPHIDPFLEGAPRIDLILIDANPCDATFRDCLRLKAHLPHVRVVLMADECSIEDVAEAFHSEAVDGYVIKRIACKPLAAALRLAAMGEKVFPAQILDASATMARQMNLHAQGAQTVGINLSARESEILACLVSGDANKVISRRLCISDATVKVHIKAILRKLHVANRTQAAIWAVNRGLAQAVPGGEAQIVRIDSAQTGAVKKSWLEAAEI